MSRSRSCPFNRRYELRAAHTSFGASGAKLPERHLACRELVGTDYHSDPCSRAVGEPHLGLRGPAVEGSVGTEPRSPQVLAKVSRGFAPGQVHDEDVEGRRCHVETSLCVASEQQPLDADPEPDPRLWRSAEPFDETVVAAAAPDRVLCRVESFCCELERGPRVVVEPPHEARLHVVLDPERIEARPEPGEVRGAFARRASRRVFGASSVTRRHSGRLAVEDPKRPVELVAVLVAQLVAVLSQVRAKRLDICRPATLRIPSN